MKLEQQVVSLELAKRLKELGTKQESLWYYDGNHNLVMFGNYVTDEYIAAFTVAELGEMLPVEVRNNFLVCEKDTDGKDVDWTVRYHPYDVDEFRMPSQVAETEAGARAKMLIYLLENNLIDNDKN